MEYERVDSSGTDDDLPSSNYNVRSKGNYTQGNGRSAVGSTPYPKMHVDMESEIHHLEQEAYGAILRAFKAQSDALTWEKEGLITELRKELRVSDDEHRELLTKVNADDIIRRIREWRKVGGNLSVVTNMAQPIHDSVPSPAVSGSRKRQKTAQSAPLGYGMPMQGLHSQSIVAIPPPLSSASRLGPSMGAAGGKRPKPMPGLSSVKSKQQHSSRGPRGHPTNNGSSGAFMAADHGEAERNPLIGRKVMTRWPEDNNFYEAVVSDYNPIEGRHALVYDSNTPNETWEWVDLKEIPPEDIRWVGDDPGIRLSNGQGGVGAKNPTSNGAIHSPGSGILPSQNGLINVSDEIEILHTETLIKQVERVVCDATHPDIVEIEKAKKMLKDHEQALVNVIARLATDASDSENDGEHQQI